MVYFAKIEWTNKVKIGKSINVAQRKKEIERDLGKKVAIVRVIKGGLKEEREIHEKYKHAMVEREIFLWSDDMMQIGESDEIGETFKPMRIPDSIHYKLKIIALHKNETIQSLATKILKTYVDGQEHEVDFSVSSGQ